MVRPGADDALYCHLDDPRAKIRYIVLDTIDIPYLYRNGKLKYQGMRYSAFSDAQLEWLANTALQVEDGWAVALFGHIPPLPALDDGEKVINADVFMRIVQAFRDGTRYRSARTGGDFGQSVTADFRGQGPREVIAFFYGHRHDDICALKDGILFVGTQCARSGLGLGDGASLLVDGAASEVAFDVITIDRAQGRIFATRFGAGSDRVIPIVSAQAQKETGAALRKGASGPRVRALQERLIDLGYLDPGSADGEFGKMTQTALEFFQSVSKIKSEGVADALTLATLFDGAAVPNPRKAFFNAGYYQRANPGMERLTSAGTWALLGHWFDTGIREGKAGSPAFDPVYYLANNPDVAAMYGGRSYAAAQLHHFSAGVLEGRRGSAGFSVDEYIALYPDVRNAFGGNRWASAKHFNDYGFDEGRLGALSPAP